jgi:hypothetical protein
MRTRKSSRKKKGSKKRHSCGVGTVLQTLLLSKESYSAKEAHSWLRKHGFKDGLDIKLDSYRARQVSPNKFKKGTFRIIPITTGVKAVVGCPK